MTASGTYSSDGGPTSTLSGSATLAPYNPKVGGADVINFLGSVDVKQKRIDIGLSAVGQGSMVNTVAGIQVPIAGSTGALDGPLGADGIPSLHLTLNGDFSIPAGVREETNGDTKARLEWDRITATHPPDLQAARSVR
jgi:hypothetical protein